MPNCSQQRELALERRQAEVRLVGLEELARVRLEQDDAGRACRGAAGRVLDRLQQRLVAPVHAVEVADRQHRAARGLGDVAGSVDDDHAMRHPFDFDGQSACH